MLNKSHANGHEGRLKHKRDIKVNPKKKMLYVNDYYFCSMGFKARKIIWKFKEMVMKTII